MPENKTTEIRCVLGRLRYGRRASPGAFLPFAVALKVLNVKLLFVLPLDEGVVRWHGESKGVSRGGGREERQSYPLQSEGTL